MPWPPDLAAFFNFWSLVATGCHRRGYPIAGVEGTQLKMTVCVVAEYPWMAVKSFGGLEPPAGIVCTDTRVTSYARKTMVRADNNERYWLAEQRTFGDNIIACYTSNNVDVTTAALDRVERGADVKSVGKSLFRLPQAIQYRQDGRTESSTGRLLFVRQFTSRYAPNGIL